MLCADNFVIFPMIKVFNLEMKKRCDDDAKWTRLSYYDPAAIQQCCLERNRTEMESA